MIIIIVIMIVAQTLWHNRTQWLATQVSGGYKRQGKKKINYNMIRGKETAI